MLKARVLTALVLGPALLAAVWLLPTGPVAAILGVIAALAAWEWTHLMGLKDTGGRLLALALFVVTLAGGWALLEIESAVPVVLVGAVGWWVLASLWTLAYGFGRGDGPPPLALSAAVGWVVLWPCWLALVYLHGHTPWGPFWLTFLLLLVWAADTGAYFAGRAYGRHRLAPRISPGKTWEGVAGGAVLAVAVGAGLVAVLQPHAPPWLYLVLLLVAVVVVSVVGDLFESMLKRRGGLKDSGGILPGHGGILDRVDSLTAAAPVLAAGLAWWQWAL